MLSLSYLTASSPELQSMVEAYYTLIVVFIAALLVSFGLSPVAGWLGLRLGLVDRPRPGEIQKRPLPRTGGYAIFVGYWVAVGLSLALLPRTDAEQYRLYGLLAGSALVLPVAIVDDAWRLGPRPQLVGQVAIAAVPTLFGVLIDNVANPFGGIVLLPLVVAAPLTLVWIVGMINTMNFIDTMDGLAGGISAIAALILFLRAVTLEQYTIAALIIGLLGACLGFLPHNLPQARLIMGTCGSMFLGYSLAALALVGGAKIATTLMVLSIPILDTALVIATRILHGRSPFRGGDSAHFPHRLLALGLSQRQILVGAYALCLVLGYLALTLSAVQKLVTFGGMGLILLGVIAVIAHRTRSTRSAEAQQAFQPDAKDK